MMSISSPTNKAGTSDTPTLLPATQSTLRNWRSDWIVLMAGLMITAAGTIFMTSSVARIAEQEFTSQCKEIQDKITERLDDHARILHSSAALFQASDVVTRKEWHIFNKAQKVEKQLPGVQGIGFSLLIPREELTRHILSISREGFPEYKLRPAGDREVYSSIIYLEPFSGRNIRAFGYDMFAEPVRRNAMERARDNDAAALSGKVTLVQETDREVQAGTLMYIPVYRKGMPIESVEQRRAAIYGWVYSPYRMNDLMRGILGAQDLEKEKHLHLQVFDGGQPSPQSLLYESFSEGEKQTRLKERFFRQIPIDFNGQRWTLRFQQIGGGYFTVAYVRVWLTMVGGIIITFLLFALIRALLNTRATARRMADNLTVNLRHAYDDMEARVHERTADLAQANQLLQSEITERRQAEDIIIEQRNLSSKYLQIAGVMIVALNTAGEITLVNKRGLDILGYEDEQELLGKNWFDCILPENVVAEVKLVFNQLMSGNAQPVEYYENVISTKNGEDRIIVFHNSLIRDKEGEISGILSSGEDITDRKRAEEALKASLREKETLLKEIHHRVKNNLQIISSLLNLQARSISDEKSEGIFKECQDRITAMASVHQLLYKSQNFAEINFGDYLQETASQLFRSYNTSGAVISLAIHAENVMLSIDTAIPCGLIINELITNTLKYAFPGDRKGEIKIEMNLTENGIRLLFEDNGIGFPKDADFRNTQTLGLKLVHMLVKQLDGTIEQFINGGTRYMIMFETETPREI